MYLLNFRSIQAAILWNYVVYMCYIELRIIREGKVRGLAKGLPPAEKNVSRMIY